MDRTDNLYHRTIWSLRSKQKQLGAEGLAHCGRTLQAFGDLAGSGAPEYYN